MPRRNRTAAAPNAHSEESYFVSLNDLLIGMLFVFIILLMIFALNYQSAEARLNRRIAALEDELGGREDQRARLLRRLKEELSRAEVPVEIDEKNGATAVKTFGVPVPPKIIARMLARHGITSQDITLVAHQSSKSIYEAWNTAIQPATYITTLEDLGDMVSSSVPVNLAKCYGEINTKYLVLMGTGMEMHATALLYLRA